MLSSHPTYSDRCSAGYVSLAHTFEFSGCRFIQIVRGHRPLNCCCTECHHAHAGSASIGRVHLGWLYGSVGVETRCSNLLFLPFCCYTITEKRNTYRYEASNWYRRHLF